VLSNSIIDFLTVSKRGDGREKRRRCEHFAQLFPV